MTGLRKDPIVDRWVIVAENRADRPSEFSPPPAAHGDPSDCPFCEGHERQTPGEVLAYRAAGTKNDQPGWRVRVVPNKYPALQPGSASEPYTGPKRERGNTIESDEILGCVPSLTLRASVLTKSLEETAEAVGVHEVIIESPDHLRSTSQLDDAAAAEVFRAYRDRLLALQGDRRLRYAQVFKNVGPQAGATIEHIHSQLLATPIVPPEVQRELDGSLALARRDGECAWCAMIHRESVLEERLVAETPGYVAFCPFAARFPLETWILPKCHADRYEQASDDSLAEFAAFARRVIGGIESLMDQPAYNYVLHTSPFDARTRDHYHWHLEILPRITQVAGFEWGAGMFINPLPPEAAAASLRQVVGGGQSTVGSEIEAAAKAAR